MPRSASICLACCLLGASMLAGCSQPAATASDMGDNPPASVPLLPSPLPPVEHPADNPFTAMKAALGRELFLDPRLSRNDKVACATCHQPGRAFSHEGRFAAGVDGKPGTRQVPSLINAAYSRSFFMDGRAATLERQAVAPIESEHEMDLRMDVLVGKLSGVESYRRQFEQVFSGQAAETTNTTKAAAVTGPRIAAALAAYERTLVSNDTPFDRHLKGERAALSPAAERGMRLFFGGARCNLCHSGPHLSDGLFHNIGGGDPKLPADPGRQAVTGNPADFGAFRTPQLREVALTAPYMHNGRFATLRDVVVHYNFGGVTDEANEHRDEKLAVLYLSEGEVDDLVAFLRDGLTTPKQPRGSTTRKLPR